MMTPNLLRFLWVLTLTTLLGGSPACSPREPLAQAPGPMAESPTESPATPGAVVDAFERNFGVHAGQRRSHSKGFCAQGTFVGNPELQRWSSSVLFSGAPMPVVARFSLPGGNPNAPDSTRNPRGMALEIRLPGGHLHNFTMLNVPVFSAATPESFLAGLLAATPDPVTGAADPERMAAYRQAYPDTAPLAAFMEGYRPPPSYGNTPYFGIHTFYLVNTEGVQTPVKWYFVPEDGQESMSEDALAAAPRDFLEVAMVERLRQGPISWQMKVVLGEADDPRDNPTLAWPDERTQIDAGRLSLTVAGSDASDDCVGINFNPLVLADGFAPSEDPVLQFRAGAYAISFGKRQQERGGAGSP